MNEIGAEGARNACIIQDSSGPISNIINCKGNSTAAETPYSALRGMLSVLQISPLNCHLCTIPLVGCNVYEPEFVKVPSTP